jgi:ABC-2 type transport system permease protein
MNTQSSAIPGAPRDSQINSSQINQSQVIAPATIPASRRLYWSVRRELWENRSVYIAPLAVAGAALFGFSLSSIAGIWEKPLRLNPAQPQGPYDMAAGLMMLTGIVVSVFYCLDALHGERRDRSILFWKSLPVSDVTTVLSKASIPLVILPVLTVSIIVAMQWFMLLMSSVVLLVSGQSVVTLWTKLSFFRMSWLVLYHVLSAHALWPAPIYCWLLLVSGWPRRATFLWAALPLVAIAGVEQIAFHTWHFAALVGSRLIGDAPAVASTSPDMFPTDPMTHIAPGGFLSSPGLWIGLAIAAAFLAAAIRLRRYQGPI